ncbi:MAG: PilZ domain-containing protein [Deltaproteobacteria bacterium]|nr:PilZ domain-containing protein [Deltaproteobacteria bacterium]
MTAAPSIQPRREDRIAIESVNLPFLGTRIDDMSLFQYLLLDISMHGAKIILPSWVIKRQMLHINDLIDFHLPFLFQGETFNKGGVAWSKWDEDLGGLTCGVRIDVRAPLYYPVFVSFEGKSIDMDLTEFQNSEDLLIRILKDTILLKKGILIYLKHIRPILPRITGFDRATLDELENFLFHDVRTNAEANMASLEKYLGRIGRDACTRSRIQQVFDLEELRMVMEPELEASVWGAAFEQEVMRQYIEAIVTLEKKVFYNYNTLVMIYAHALTRSGPVCTLDEMEAHHETGT